MKKTLLALVLLGFSIGAHAQAWPAKPIRWVVPYTPAGITDNVTRMVTQKLQEALGQSIVIENKPGAKLDRRRGPDREVAARWLQHPDSHRRARSERDAVRGQAPVRSGEELHSDLACRDCAADLTANNNFPAKNAKELIDYAKKNPGQGGFRLIRHRSGGAPDDGTA
jgi:hypothetical protein